MTLSHGIHPCLPVFSVYFSLKIRTASASSLASHSRVCPADPVLPHRAQVWNDGPGDTTTWMEAEDHCEECTEFEVIAILRI